MTRKEKRKAKRRRKAAYIAEHGHVHVESAEAPYRPAIVYGDPGSAQVVEMIRRQTIERTRSAPSAGATPH